MDSKIPPCARGLKACWTGALVCALFPFGTTAQTLAELGNVVFEPVLLATAIESPFELASENPSADEELANAIDRRLDTLQPLRNSGSSEPALIEQLALVALGHQRLGQHAEALELLEEAVELTIDNGGRNNLEQVPLQKQKVSSYLALDDVESVEDTEERIFALYRRNYEPGDRQMYFATVRLTDWLTAAYYKENYGAGRQALKRSRMVVERVQRCIRLPGSTTGEGASECLENPIFTGEIKNVFEQDVIDERLKEIDRLYADYQKAVFEGGSAQVDVIADLAKRVARLAYTTKQEMDFERDNYGVDPNYEGSREQAARNSPARMQESYESGERALKYAISVLRSAEGVRADAVGATLVDLGDWHLAYGKASAAEEAYGEAYRHLIDAGYTRDSVDRALHAELPVRIPVFATHLHTRRTIGLPDDEPLAFHGYVDVSYVIDRLGNVSDIGFHGSSTEDPAAIERLISRQLNSMKFRPILSGGELTGPGRVEARYYYSY